MALKIDTNGPNIFPHVERVDANPIKGGYEVKLFTRIEGELKPTVIKLTDTQAHNLSEMLTARS